MAVGSTRPNDRTRDNLAGVGCPEGTGWGRSSRLARSFACALFCFSCRAPEAGRIAPSSAVSAKASASSAFASSPTAVGPALLVTNPEPGAFALRATRPVQVATSSRLERRNADGTWVPVPVSEDSPGYLLRESCSAPSPPACLSLGAGETLLPVAWSGDDCAVQCGKPCWPEQFRSGTHRLVVTSCASPQEQFEGPAFEMPSSSKALGRLRAATGVTHVRAVRVDGVGIRLEPATGSAPERVAGLKEISGTSHELGPELTAELLQWLRAEGGFNDLVARRCLPGISVGFVFSHEAASASKPAMRTELSVDIGCWALNIVRNGEEFSFSHFDPSYEPLFGILRRVFPNDRQLMHEIDRQLEAAAHEKTRAARSRAQ